METLNPACTALLVIDVQQGFDRLESAGARRNNPQAVARIADLLAAFRRHGGRIVHIRHASRAPEALFHAAQPGHAVQDAAREQNGEPVIVKSVNSAFIGTDLHARLTAGAIETLVIVGATTNHCVETTTRMAGNLGYRAILVRDACWCFDRVGPDGEVYPAAMVQAMTLANLHQEFALIATSEAVIRALADPPA